MSSALLRQALEFVDPDESSDKRKKRGVVRAQSSSGQDSELQKQIHHKKPKKIGLKKQKGAEPDKQVTEEVISKLLKLSESTLDKKIAKKIVKRAVTGKPVGDKIEVKVDEQKSILFPDEDFKQFERTPFCR